MAGMGMQRFRRASGSQIGGNAIRTYVCASCGTWTVSKAGGPKQCVGCGLLEFIAFSSRAEAKRYGELTLLLKVKKIADLQLQPRFDLHVVNPAGVPVKIGAYVADFGYLDLDTGKKVVEDVKGSAVTDMFLWKRRHFEAQYGHVLIVIER